MSIEGGNLENRINIEGGENNQEKIPHDSDEAKEPAERSDVVDIGEREFWIGGRAYLALLGVREGNEDLYARWFTEGKEFERKVSSQKRDWNSSQQHRRYLRNPFDEKIYEQATGLGDNLNTMQKAMSCDEIELAHGWGEVFGQFFDGRPSSQGIVGNLQSAQEKFDPDNNNEHKYGFSRAGYGIAVAALRSIVADVKENDHAFDVAAKALAFARSIEMSPSERQKYEGYVNSVVSDLSKDEHNKYRFERTCQQIAKEKAAKEKGKTNDNPNQSQTK